MKDAVKKDWCRQTWALLWFFYEADSLAAITKQAESNWEALWNLDCLRRGFSHANSKFNAFPVFCSHLPQALSEILPSAHNYKQKLFSSWQILWNLLLFKTTATNLILIERRVIVFIAGNWINAASRKHQGRPICFLLLIYDRPGTRLLCLFYDLSYDTLSKIATVIPPQADTRPGQGKNVLLSMPQAHLPARSSWKQMAHWHIFQAKLWFKVNFSLNASFKPAVWRIQFYVK